MSDKLPKQLQAPEELQAHYDQFKRDVTTKALKVLTDIIPEKLKQYNEKCPISADNGVITNMDDFPANAPIYAVPNVVIEGGESEGEEEGAKAPRIGKRHRTDMVAPKSNVMKLPKYIYTSEQLINKDIEKRTEDLKKESASLLELVSCVKLWIQLNIPKIEDGNNFGVAIQEEVINELSRVEEAAFSLREATSKYYLNRAKLVTKVIKYPNVEDYRKGLRELDERQWFQMKVSDMDTRNNYAIIYDMLYKNWHKVVKPRNQSGQSMIY